MSATTEEAVCQQAHVVHMSCTVYVMLTNFTVSVVFLYGVVFGEADPSHPFQAFRCG